MPIAFARVTYHTRTKGHSSVAGSAYRSGQTLHDERTGITHHYDKRDDIAYESILLPEGASDSFKNRETLWNEVERSERRKNSQVAKDVVLALPKELPLEDHITLARQFAHTHFVSKGLVVDIAIHTHSKDNPHAHLYVTTRRLDGNQFSRLKARDLQPKVAKGFVVEQDAWGEAWRAFQNDYFKQHQINLVVDSNHIITRRHEGHIRSNEPHYLKADNQLRHKESQTILMHEPDSLLNLLTTRVGVFSERDVAQLVFKTLDDQEGKAVFDKVMATLLAHQDVIALGTGDDGRERYTTRAHFNLELDLCRHAEVLMTRKTGRVTSRQVKHAVNTFSLSKEQTQALGYLMRTSGLRILVGRAGTGKSYLMKAANHLWATNGYHVVGMAPSAVAANALADASGITCHTVAYYQKLWSLEKIHWDNTTVVVMDEAGMTDLVALHAIVDAASKTGAKLVLVGDDAQLLPVGKGAPLRALAQTHGFCELSGIRRQENISDRQASFVLSQGRVNEAVGHYHEQQAIHYGSGSALVSTLVSDWAAGLTPHNLPERLMMTHCNVDVAHLNQAARAECIRLGFIDTRYEITVGTGQSARVFSPGDRVLFGANEGPLFSNGDKGRVVSCGDAWLRIQLDNGKTVTVDTQKPIKLDYGYATTVHKAQGATVDKAFVFINSWGWDRHLSYVAMTRHRQTLQVYVNQSIVNHADQLTEHLSRRPIKDNVLDFPLFYAIRRGFAPEGLVNRFVNRVRRVKTVVRDGWTYLVRYAAYQQQKQHRERLRVLQRERITQRRVADLVAAHQQWGQAWHDVLARVPPALLLAQLHGVVRGINHPDLARLYQSWVGTVLHKLSSVPSARNLLYQLQVQRARLGSAIYRRLPQYERGLSHYALKHADLARMHRWYRQHQAVSGFVQAQAICSKEWMHAYAAFIREDIKGHWPHLMQMASQQGVSAHTLTQAIHRAGLLPVADRIAGVMHRLSAPTATTVIPPSFTAKPVYDADAINTALMQESERFYAQYLEGNGRRVGTGIRYGAQGSLSVTMDGPHAGCWYSFETGEGGGPLQFLMSRAHGLGLSFKEALQEGVRFSGITRESLCTLAVKQAPTALSQASEPEDTSERIARARHYYDTGQPIEGTLGERYLREHRQLSGDLSAFRFHPAIYDNEQKQTYPGVVVAARDSKGAITATQTILLDNVTGQKANDVAVVKRTRGVVKGSAVLMHEGSGSQVVIAEGPETGASLIKALPEANIYVTLGNSKNAVYLGWLAEKHGTRDLYFAADNDGKHRQNLDAIDTVAGALKGQGITCHRSYPVLYGRDKCDFNDVLQAQGTEAVRQQVTMWQWVVPKTRAPQRAQSEDTAKRNATDWRAPHLEKEWRQLVNKKEVSSSVASLCYWYQQWQKETDPSKKVRLEKNVAKHAVKIASKKRLLEILQSVAPSLANCVIALKRSHEKTHTRSR